MSNLSFRERVFTPNTRLKGFIETRKLEIIFQEFIQDIGKDILNICACPKEKGKLLVMVERRAGEMR